MKWRPGDPRALRRVFDETVGTTTRFSPETRARFARSLLRALAPRGGAVGALRDATRDAVRELRLSGLSAEETAGVLSALVADAGRACGADRPSLMTGASRWMPICDTVLAIAAEEYATPVSLETATTS